MPHDDSEKTLEEQMLAEVDAFEKSLDDFDAPPANRMAKAKTEGTDDEDEYAGMSEEDKGKAIAAKAAKAKTAAAKPAETKKSFLEELEEAEAKLDQEDDFDPEILKSLGELDGDEDSQINAKELMKALSKQITAQIGLVGTKVEAQNAKIEAQGEQIETMQKASLRVTQGLTRVQGNVTTIADTPGGGGRRSARSAGMTEADFAKAQQIHGRTWDSALDAAQVAVAKSELDSRSAAKLETCFNKGMPITEAQGMFPELFKAIGPHMKEVTLQ